MGIFGAAKRGLGMLGRIGKKKAVTKAPAKISKHEKFMQLDPFVRNRILDARESAKKGDVYKGTSVMDTPSKERSAKSIKKFWGPRSYQLTDPARKKRTPKALGALVRGAKSIVKHTPWRKELAGYKRTHRAKQKLLKGRAQRKEAAHQAAVAPKYGPYGKELASQYKHPKSWKRAGKK